MPAPAGLPAMRYFYAYELPKVAAWLAVVHARDPVCRDDARRMVLKSQEK